MIKISDPSKTILVQNEHFHEMYQELQNNFMHS